MVLKLVQWHRLILDNSAYGLVGLLSGSLRSSRFLSESAGGARRHLLVFASISYSLSALRKKKETTATQANYPAILHSLSHFNC